MRREDDQELWDLLGNAPAPSASPFFARNVLRQVRMEVPERRTFGSWLRPQILGSAAVFVIAVTFAGISIDRGLKSGSVGDNPPEAIAAVEPQDFDVVTDLDDLIASDDDSLWDDDSLPL